MKKQIIFFADQRFVFKTQVSNLEESFDDVCEIHLFTKPEEVFEQIKSIPANVPYVLVLDSVLPGQNVDDMFSGTKNFFKDLKKLEEDLVATRSRSYGIEPLENRAKVIIFSPTLFEEEVHFDFFFFFNSEVEQADDELVSMLQKALLIAA